MDHIWLVIPKLGNSEDIFWWRLGHWDLDMLTRLWPVLCPSRTAFQSFATMKRHFLLLSDYEDIYWSFWMRYGCTCVTTPLYIYAPWRARDVVFPCCLPLTVSECKDNQINFLLSERYVNMCQYLSSYLSLSRQVSFYTYVEYVLKVSHSGFHS